jgi:hypothetical protein
MNKVELSSPHLSPQAFVAEVADFRDVVADPSLDIADKQAAWQEVVLHAGMLDPRALGFEGAGIALKEALCLWLDIRPGTHH